jgi:microsomal dipeptidase-like Zn-dependent dipeptidase
MPFFDFHIHPTLKSMFSEGPQKLSPWQKLDIRKIPNLLRWCSEFQYILQSQSNLAQLIYNECNMVCIALYAPERGMIDNELILGQADGSLGVYMNKARIKKMISSQLQPYRDVLADDLNTLTNEGLFGITDREIVFLDDPAKYDPASTNKLYVVFSVEGCHTFTSSLRKFDVNEILRNLDDLRSKVPLISINLTHIEQSKICNHAFGMLFINNDVFRPTGKLISAEGFQIVQHCYRNNILIDIKHMSLGARDQLYRVRQSADFANINQPVVCTHAGFTGISTSEIPDYILDYRQFQKGYVLLKNGKPAKYGRFMRPSFNASSINLYDEDIMAILNSGGIIGLSMDKRILGFQESKGNANADPNFPFEPEYISFLERDYFFTREEVGHAFLEGKCIEWTEVENAGTVNPLAADYHLRHFMAHIIHLIVVAQRNQYDVNKALSQVCIGSDFDGIINPVWCCDTVDELTYFKEAFERQFPDFASECANENGVRLPAGFDIRRFSNQLFFENGKNFVLDRVAKINP